MIYSFKKLVWNNHFFSKLYTRFLKKRHLLVDKGTNLVIEGYPRCANTFAVTALMEMARRDLNVAHHLHYPIQVSYAVKNNIPVMLLIRKPEDAIVSLVIREGYSLSLAMNMYIDFYTTLIPYKDSIFVSGFDSVTKNVYSELNKFNRDFKLNFKSHTIFSDEEILGKVEKWNEVDSGGDVRKSSAPSDKRVRLSKELKIELKQLKFKERLDKANEIYSFFLS